MVRPDLTRRRAFSLAWPMIFAQAAQPLAGLTDTAVISLSGTAAEIGGVGLGIIAYSPLYWGFYFLRMGTTGLAAQAEGAEEEGQLQRVLLRALAVAMAGGLAIILLQSLWRAAAFGVLSGSADVERAADAYLAARLWGAPAALGMFAITGWLIGLGRTRAMLAVNFVFAGVNIALDLWFVLGLALGPGGVGWATSLAEYAAMAAGGALVLREIVRRGGWSEDTFDWARLRDLAAVAALFKISTALFIRSMTLVLAFGWFQNTAARLGDVVIASNQVLLQFITLWAFALDAFAFTAEAEVGAAVGRRDRARLRNAVRITSELALGGAIVFCLVTLAAGPPVLRLMVEDEAVRAAALAYLPFVALAPILGAPAWQLDGVFTGATRAWTMAAAAVASALAYLFTDRLVTPTYGVAGLWGAFLAYYVYRALFLAVAYPSLERQTTAPKL